MQHMKQYLWSDVEKWFIEFFSSKIKTEKLFEQRERFRKGLMAKIKRERETINMLIKNKTKNS